MDTHDRRAFLRTAGAATLGLPAFLAGFLDAQDPQPGAQDPATPKRPTRAEQLAEAVARGKREDRPLLVFVVPDDERAVWDRSLWFGAFLNHADPVALLEVALCVPACATAAEVRTQVGTPSAPDDPMLMLVDFGDTGAATITPIRPELGEIPGTDRRAGPRDELVEREQQTFESGIEKLTGELHRAMHLSGHTIANLAERARARLDGAQRRALDTWFAGGPPPADELLVRATAIVRDTAASGSDARRKALIEAQLGAIDRVLIHRRIPGSPWASSTGCGVTIEQPQEHEAQLHVRCGMGHVPEPAQRFLQFLNDR